MKTYRSLTGPELKAIRRKAGLTQTDMAKIVGCTRYIVSRYETKRRAFLPREYCWGCLARIFEVLRVRVLPHSEIKTPVLEAQAYGVLLKPDKNSKCLDRIKSRNKARDAAKISTNRWTCRAKTRKGHPCRLLSEPGKRRCKFHGGMSTGPKTEEGKARIAEAQRQRWASYRIKSKGKID